VGVLVWIIPVDLQEDIEIINARVAKMVWKREIKGETLSLLEK